MRIGEQAVAARAPWYCVWLRVCLQAGSADCRCGGGVRLT